jgi:Lamin Tail Domain
MKQLATLLFFLSSLTIQAQVIEEFSDGNLNSNPAWAGDQSQFTINSNYQLQLNSSGSDSSYLSFSSPLNASDSLQWEIWVQQSFSPSSQNYGRVYLTSDNANLEQALNGYYLQFGESGSADAISLFKQTGYNTSLICRGIDATISNSFIVRVKVIRTINGEWKVYTDYSGGTNFTEEASGIENSINNFQYFGIKDVYTSSNATKFYYDHIYAGEYIADTLNPSITGIDILDSVSVRVHFSEKIRNTDANNTAHFYIDGNMVSSSIQDIGMTSVVLTSSQIFTSPNIYQLLAYQIHDLEGNLTAIDSINFQYLTTDTIAPHNLIITEIMSAPSGANNLPNAEYIEVFNRSQKYINTSGFTITDGSTDATLPNDTIEPGGYRVYFNNSHLAEFQQLQIPNLKGLSTFPGLNNDGDHITLKDAIGNIIDKISYTLSSYHDAIKQNGGWSIERKDPEFTCSNEDNWQASKDFSGGTPGKENSERKTFIDETAPDISYITVTDSLNIEIHFTEIPELSEATNISNYSINQGINIQKIKAAEENELIYLLNLQQPLQRNITYKLSANTISDCAGNTIQNTNEISFGIGEEIKKGDLIINEILFNPGDGQYDYVELYNNSSKILSLSKSNLAQKDILTGEIKTTEIITDEKRVICPGEYLVISENTSFLNNYKNYNHRTAIQASTPSMNDDEGIISILSPGLEEIDILHYTEKMQYPLLSEVEGVALERVRFSSASEEVSNWHSASYQCGYGTPGRENSQALNTIEGENMEIQITPAIISPDNDGNNDIALITSKGIRGTGSISIFDESGKMIRKVAEGEYMGTGNEYVWDGSNNKGIVVPVGVYIVLTEITQEGGEIIQSKKPIVVAQKVEKVN